MNFSFPKRNKLKKHSQISEVFTNKTFFKKNDIRLFYKEISKTEENKTAFFIPKKYIKLAINRKKIKRRLSECFRKEFPYTKKHISQYFHFIFIYECCEIKNYNEINAIVKKLLNLIKSKYPIN